MERHGPSYQYPIRRKPSSLQPVLPKKRYVPPLETDIFTEVPPKPDIEVSKPSRIAAYITYVIIAVMCVFNLPLLHKAAKTMAENELYSLSSFIETVTATYKSDSLFGKNLFVSINGGLMNISGRKVCNNVHKLRNGMLTEFSRAGDSSGYAEKIAGFGHAVEKMGPRFLFVQAPNKMDINRELMMEYDSDNTKSRVDTMLSTLEKENINCLDLRKYICVTPSDVTENFYATDHHWNPKGAFIGYRQVMKKLAEEPGFGITENYTDEKFWKLNIKKNFFLGSQGKRTGPLFAGVDDLMWYTPTFETKMERTVPDKKDWFAGDYSDACLDMKYAETFDYFGMANDCVYYGGNHPLMVLKNSMAPNHNKLIIIKDSYANSMMPFLHAEFTDIEVVDPRYYKWSTVLEYIYMHRSDMVIFLQNPSTYSPEFYDALGEEDGEKLRKKPKGRNVFSKQNLTIKPSESKYSSYQCEAKYKKNHFYEITINGLTVREGSPEAVVMEIYNKSSNKTCCAQIWKLPAAGELKWMVKWPDEKGDVRLRLFAGEDGKTQGNSLNLKSVVIRDITP